VRGYNPTKQGRPSHVYQTYFIAAIRMVLDVEVQAGNQTASIYAQPGLWAWVGRRPREQWPKLVRGDIAWGAEAMLVECEKRNLPLLFKIRQTTRVQRHIAGLFGRTDWAPAGGDWQGLSSELQLTGWRRKRRVIVLRRPIREIAQLYRDRAEAENAFDKLKNQWGWAGFTTQDQQRRQILARIVAPIYNWWSLFTRLAIPNRHTEATASRQGFHPAQRQAALTAPGRDAARNPGRREWQGSGWSRARKIGHFYFSEK
jgi:hypothetical protein